MLQRMCKRVEALKCIKECNLSEDNIRYFQPDEIIEACGKIIRWNLKEYMKDGKYKNSERSIIATHDFAGKYAKLIDNGFTESEIEQWVIEFTENGEEISALIPKQLVYVKSLGLPWISASYEFLKYFADSGKKEDEVQQLIENIVVFYRQSEVTISQLEDWQREFLWMPFLKLLLPDSIIKIFNRLKESTILCSILSFLYEEGIDIELGWEQINLLSKLDGQVEENLRKIHRILKTHENKSLFWERWIENDMHGYDLQWLGSIKELGEGKIRELLDTQIGYINVIYGGRLHGISFDKVRSYQLSVLIYAITEKKEHFLRIVTSNFDTFIELEYNSILFNPEFYKRCNLNTLTYKDMVTCRPRHGAQENLCLLEKREFTFKEIITLCYVKKQYIQLYNQLDIPKVDNRLIVIRQLIKKKLLENVTSLKI